MLNDPLLPDRAAVLGCSRFEDALRLAQAYLPTVKLDAKVLDFLYANRSCRPMPRDEWERDVRLTIALELMLRHLLNAPCPDWVKALIDLETQSAIRKQLSMPLGTLNLIFHGGFVALRRTLFSWLFPNGTWIGLRSGYLVEDPVHALFGAREAILAGRPLLMAPDGRFGKETTTINVLGAQRAVSDGAPFLAYATGCPVAWFAAERTDAGFTLRTAIGPRAEPGEPFEVYRERFYQFYTAQLEAVFTGHPRNVTLLPYWSETFGAMLKGTIDRRREQMPVAPSDPKITAPAVTGPADLLTQLKINPAAPDGTVFKYLARDDRPHALRNVRHKALIACTSRSGSSLLLSCLERYGIKGGEFFNPETKVARAVRAGQARTICDYADYLARTAVVNDRFVVKGGLAPFLFLYHLHELPDHRDDWKIVFLRRENTIRQAVSMEIVRITRQWNSTIKPEAAVDDASYSFDALRKNLEAIVAQNDRWERIFSVLDITPLRITYEDFTRDLPGETERVARFLGIDPAAYPQARDHVPKLEAQGTAVNDEWERRVRADLERTSPDRT